MDDIYTHKIRYCTRKTSCDHRSLGHAGSDWFFLLTLSLMRRDSQFNPISPGHDDDEDNDEEEDKAFIEQICPELKRY